MTENANPEPLANPQQIIEQDSFSLAQLVDQNSQVSLRGSFSERNPQLGRMLNCAFCGHRHRQGEEHRANPEYSVTNKAEQPRAQFARRRKVSHTHAGGQPHPGNANLVHQLILEFQRDDDRLLRARLQMTRNANTEILPEHIGPFAAAYVDWLERHRRKARRLRQAIARKINKNLASPGTRIKGDSRYEKLASSSFGKSVFTRTGPDTRSDHYTVTDALGANNGPSSSGEGEVQGNSGNA